MKIVTKAAYEAPFIAGDNNERMCYYVCDL